MWQMFLGTLLAYGQNAITGYVYDGKAPIFAANVFLANNPDIGTITDEKGYFKLDIAAGSLLKDSLTIRFLGYKDYKTALSELKNPCKIKMEPDNSGIMLSEVIVKSNLSASKEFAVEQLDKVSIYMTPAAGADPLKAVGLQPYSTSTEESANPELRGSSGNYSRVLINGVPIKKTYPQPAAQRNRTF